MNPSDYSVITFPFLGLELNPPRTLELGPLSIHLYGMAIALGLMLAVLYAWRRAKEFGVKEDDLTDGVLWVVPFAVLCARLYYCIFQWDSYKANPIRILYIWEGGLAIYGGVIGAALGVIVFCKFKKIKTATILDMVALGFFIGQSLGRWGNFFNREAVGVIDQNSGWFLKMGLLNIYTNKVEYCHPTFFYESVWNAIGFVLLHFLSKKRRYDGQVGLGYVAWYGLGRAIIEGLREDSLMLGSLRVSQILALGSCLIAVGILVWQHFKPHDPEKLFVNQVAARAAAEAPAEDTATEE